MLRSISLQNTFVIYLIMIVLGVVSGLSGIHLIESIGLIISEVFIRIFRCISTPIIALSIIVTLATYGEEGSMSKVWRKTMLYTISTTLFAAIVSLLIYTLIHPQNVSSQVAPSLNTAIQQESYIQHLVSIVPTNIFTPFIEHQVMGVLLIAILIGLAIRHIPDAEARSTVKNFIRGMHGVFFVVTKWIVAILPIGLYGFITATTVQFNHGMHIGGIGAYLLVIVLSNVVQGLIVLPLWLRWHGIAPFDTLRKMMPALSVAFFSKSSAGTLPVTMNTAEKNLQVDKRISRFVLPLCTSLNMNGCAAFIFTTVIYLMQNNGMDISLLTMAAWVLIATIAAIGNAGVPMGCFFLSASLLSSMDVPIVLLGIILPFYNIIDMIETSLNVWSDSCVAVVVNQQYVREQAGALPQGQELPAQLVA